MTTQSITKRPSLLARIGNALVSWGEAMSKAQGHAALFQELQAMSDAQLQEIGLRREDIARYVYRDMYYV